MSRECDSRRKKTLGGDRFAKEQDKQGGEVRGKRGGISPAFKKTCLPPGMLLNVYMQQLRAPESDTVCERTVRVGI